jgi:Tfp pilus assembly protein PilF
MGPRLPHLRPLLARLAPTSTADAEECVDRADQAMAEARWDDAALWFRRAHSLATSCGRVCADLAFALERTGRRAEALAMYDEAARLHCAPGEALLHGSLLALREGQVAEAEARLVRALQADPGLSGEAHEARARLGQSRVFDRVQRARRTRDGKAA